jgi:hypothetical protein
VKVNLDFQVNETSIYLHEILLEYLRIRKKRRAFLNGLAFYDTGARISLSGKINDSWLIICTHVICDKKEGDKSLARKRETERQRERERISANFTMGSINVDSFVVSA